MSETISSQLPSQPPPALPVHPSDILMNLIVAVLAPMFLTASNGDFNFARMAAIETINTYRARNNADLIAIAQIIACGLTALGSLSLSLLDNLSLSMTVRLRANAVALNRIADQNRRALTKSHPDELSTPHFDPDSAETAFAAGSADALQEAEVLASLAAAQTLTAEAQTRLCDPSQAIVPPPAAPEISPSAGPVLTDEQCQAMWAAAMTDVAGEFTANLKNLPPAERRMASHRAAMLSTCANQLIAGDVPPPLRPGDLGMFR